MEKVKISKEQKNFVDKMNDDFGRDAFKEYLKSKTGTTPMEVFELEKVSLIFNGWYEVEEEQYEVGDYLHNPVQDTYFKVNRKDGGVIFTEPTVNYLDFTVESDHPAFVKVKEEWKRKLLDSGRPKPTLKINDVLLTKAGYIMVNNSFQSEEIMYELLEEGRVEFIYPVEQVIMI